MIYIYVFEIMVLIGVCLYITFKIIEKLIVTFIWKTYEVTMLTTDRKFEHVEYFRGFVWDVVNMSLESAKERPEVDGKKWAIKSIKQL